MPHDPSIKTKIRALIADALRERLDYRTMMADLTEGAERNEHLASIAALQTMLDRGAAIRAAETRH